MSLPPAVAPVARGFRLRKRFIVALSLWWWISHYQIIMAMESLSWPFIAIAHDCSCCGGIVEWHPSRQIMVLENLSRISIDIAISLKENIASRIRRTVKE